MIVHRARRLNTLGFAAGVLVLPAMLLAVEPEPADPLSGPRVREGGSASGGEPTLVERAFDGTLRTYDVRIEEAAAERLDLKDSERAAVRRVLDERAAAMDAIVRENIELLLKGVAAQQAGDRAAQRAHLAEMREAFGPLGERGGLLSELAAALPAEKALRLRAMVQEYWRARVRDEVNAQRRERIREMEGGEKEAMPPAGGDRGPDEAPADDPPGGMMDEENPRAASRAERAEAARILPRLMLQEFGREVKRSYDRIAAEGQRRLEESIAALGLSPEQEGRVRRLVTEFAQESKLNPTAAQRTAFFARVLKELTPEQRKKLVRMARQGE